METSMEPIKNIYFNDNVNMSDAVTFCMHKYAAFNIESMFPHSVDGLLKVHRRILTVLANEKNRPIQKVASWAGTIINYHPHGDGSIAQTMSRLMQVFNYQIPLLNTHGDSGSFRDTDGAQPRYLRASLSEFVKDVYLDIPKEALVYKASEVSEGLEIEYYIPKIPMALLLSVIGIGTGFKSTTVPRDISNVCDLALWYIEQYQKDNVSFIINNQFPKEIAKLLLPMFPISCNILNEEELIEEYSKGNFDHRISIEGDYYLNKNTITIKTLPFGLTFEKKLDELVSIIQSKKKEFSSFIDAIDEYKDSIDGKLSLDFQISFKRKNNVWNMLHDINKIFSLYEKFTPESRYLSKENINQLLGPGQLLDIWYRERERALIIKFGKEQNMLVRNIHRLMGLQIIKDHVDEVVDIIKKAEDSKIYIPDLQERFQLTYFQASEIGKMNIDQLTRSNRENIQNLINRDKNKLKQIKEKVLNISETIKEEVKYIKKKYGEKAPKATKFPNYLGYIKTIENGYVLLTNYKEIAKSKDLNIDEVFITHPNSFKYQFRDRDTYNLNINHPVIFPKYFTSNYFNHSPVIPNNTVILNTDENNDNTIFYTDGYKLIRDDNNIKSYCYTDKEIITIDKTGIVTSIDIETLPYRKTTHSLGNKCNILHVSNEVYKNVIIFYTNINEPNIIRCSVITDKQGKLNMLTTTELTKFYIFPFTENMIMFKIDVDIFNRVRPAHLKIDNPITFMGDSNFTMIDVNRETSSHNKKAKFQLVRYE